MKVLAKKEWASHLRVVRLSMEWKLEDFWVGASWRRQPGHLQVWACLVPCLPIHLSWTRL